MAGLNPSSTLTKADGVALAIQMLHEIETIGSDRFAIRQEYRDFYQKGAPQDDIVRRYLQRAFTTGNGEFLSGFSSVLTDYVATCVQGCVPDVESYAGLTPVDLGEEQRHAM
jgi:hypothetical protein